MDLHQILAFLNLMLFNPKFPTHLSMSAKLEETDRGQVLHVYLIKLFYGMIIWAIKMM